MTKRSSNKTDAGGRPLSYDPALVHQIISEGFAAGRPATDLDADFVKAELCSKHDVSSTIRKDTLESLVVAAHEDIAEAENRALLKALPEGIAPAVNEAVAAAGQGLLLMVARQHAVSQAIVDQACEELRADKRNAQLRIKVLEGDLAEEKEIRQALEKERDELAAQLAEAQESLRITRADLERLSRDPNGVDRLLAELRNPAIRDDIRSVLADIVTSASSEKAR